jgi:hypothetical protein
MRASGTERTAVVFLVCILSLLLVSCSASVGKVSPSPHASSPARSQPPGTTQIADAAAVAAAKGYADCGTSLYGASSRLHALVCVARGADSANQLAFFFLDSTYIGTDTSAPSAHIIASWRDEDTVALLYVLYRPNDGTCCPTGGGAIVRYYWDGSRLQPLDPVPTNHIDAALSRR